MTGCCGIQLASQVTEVAGIRAQANCFGGVEVEAQTSETGKIRFTNGKHALMHVMAKHQYLLILLLVVAAGIRLIGFSSQSLTMDECMEISTAESSSQEILYAANSFPPLYHLLLKAWFAIDPTPLAVRTFSLIVGLGSIWVIGRLATEAVSEKVGVLAAAVATFSPFHIYYSQQGRAYMLYILLGALAMQYGLRLVREPSNGNRLAFVMIGVLGGYAHYYFALVLVSIGIGILIVNGPSSFLKQVVPPALAIGMLCSPLVWLLADDLNYQRDLREPRPASLSAIGYTFFSFESGYTLGASRSELHWLPPDDAFQMALPWIIPIAILVSFLGWQGIIELRKTGTLGYWACLLVIPFVAVVMLCAWLGVTYNTRFLVAAWIPYVLVIASGLGGIRRQPLLLLVASLLAFIYGSAIYNRHVLPRYQNEDMRAVARFLEAAEPRPVLVCAGYMDRPLKKYMAHPETIIRVRDRSCAGSDEEAIAKIQSYKEPFWFVYSREFHGDPEGAILSAIREHGELQSELEAAGVVVYDGRPPREERSTQ